MTDIGYTVPRRGVWGPARVSSMSRHVVVLSTKPCTNTRRTLCVRPVRTRCRSGYPERPAATKIDKLLELAAVARDAAGELSQRLRIAAVPSSRAPGNLLSQAASRAKWLLYALTSPICSARLLSSGARTPRASVRACPDDASHIGRACLGAG